MSRRPIKRVAAGWTDVVLVCRKCSKRLGGEGFGRHGDERLAKALRRALDLPKDGRKASVGIIETGCFDVCPKDAVVAVAAGRPADWLVIRRGTPIDEIVDRLGLSPNIPET